MVLVLKEMTVSWERHIIKSVITVVKGGAGVGIHLTQVCSFQSSGKFLKS